MRKTKEIKEIINKNDLLGFMLQIQNTNHDCYADLIIKKMGIEKSSDLEYFISELQNDGFIKIMGLNDIHITPKGQKGYISPLKNKWLKAKPYVLYIITYILGILTPLLIEYLKTLLFGSE